MPARRRSSVLCTVVLLLTGTVLPVMAIPSPADDQTIPSESVGHGHPSHPATHNETAVVGKRAAIATIEGIDVGWRFQARQRDRAVAQLNGTLSAYRDDHRVSAPSVFRDDRRALGALAMVAWADPAAAGDAADLVVSADLATVDTAIADARFALDRVAGQIGDRRELRRAEREIERAERARARGVDALDGETRSPWRWTNRQRTLVHLGIAWLHAQRALDVLDRASAPAVTIHPRSDPPLNGSGAAERTIRGTVSDVQAYELGNVSVAVNGTRVGSTPLDVVSAPSHDATFAANVTLDGPAAEVTVTVEDVDEKHPHWRDGSRAAWWPRFGRSRGGSPAEARFGRFEGIGFDDTSVNGRSDTDVVRFDGDGLPDEYETSVVLTDPLDPDSDSSATGSNEGGDGRFDGGEDFDDDGLITYAEYELGTDPFENDTDGDGLPDRFEASIPNVLEPIDADTDDDGVDDGEEDFDDDGLSVAHEHAMGTSIARPDTDSDGLDDGEEVGPHDTSPLVADTDEDGLGDAEELRWGTDPLVADTDGDGVVDGEESFETTMSDEETGTRVAIEGHGDVASSLSVENVSQPGGSDHLAAPVVRIQNRTPFENATVTLPIAGGAVVAPENLSVYKWSPDQDRPWHALNSTIDVANRTASAEVSSFSYFTVMDGPEWEAAITDSITPVWPHHEAFDDLDGWDVEGHTHVEDGTLVVSASGGSPIEPDIVVATDGTGDFERIQPAVDSAAEGQTILVRDGRYREEVLIDVSVTLSSENATLDGAGLDRDAVGIQVVDGTTVALAGLTIQGYELGVNGAGTSADVRLSRVALLRNEVGVHAEESTGDWTLEAVTASMNSRSGVEAGSSTGGWTVSDAELRGNGWHGIEADRAEGNWTVVDTLVTGSELAGVSAYRSAGGWSLVRVNVSRNDGTGLDAYRASGTWRLTEGDLSRNGGEGIDTFGASGDWTLRNVDVSGNDGNGIDALGAMGDWTILRGNASGNGWTGIVAGDTSGSWDVTSSSLVGNGDTGFDAYGGSGTARIVGSQLHGNGDVDVSGPDYPHEVDARGNWWGGPSGPTDDQYAGTVVTDPHCASDDCLGFDTAGSMRVAGEPAREHIEEVDDTGHAASVGASRRLDKVLGAGAPRSAAVSREVALPDGASVIGLTARLRGDGSPDAPASIRVVGDTGMVTVAEVTSDRDTFATNSANLTPYAGETVAVEIVASSGALVEVDWFEIVVDSDGDGLRDIVETVDLGMPTGPRPGVSLESLDPTDPDSDGDGLLDGEELTVVSVERPLEGPTERIRFRAEAADADPTLENSDGGGLTDGEEAEAGSDPFVLETLVIGYTIPTMTEGPGDTLEDREPMTVGESNGLHTGVGRDSNLIAWPSRQFFDPLFCIKELTDGPGCAPEWMIGTEPKEDMLYVYVPFVVYAESDAEIGEVPYQISFNPISSATVVKGDNVRGKVAPGRSQRGYVVYELPEIRVGEEGQPGAFRAIGHVTLQSGLSTTIFKRETTASVTRRYSVSTSSLLPATEQMLEDTQFVLEHGMNVALAAEAGTTVAIKTGSRSKGAIVFLYELAMSQVDTPPKSIDDVAMNVSLRGISSFREQVSRSESEIYRDVFEDGVVRPVGATIIRQN